MQKQLAYVSPGIWLFNAPILYEHEAIEQVTEVSEVVQFLKLGDYAVDPDTLYHISLLSRP
jgi:hypothetical protein